MQYLFLLGRLLYGGVLIYMGLQHFLQLKGYTAYAESNGVPSAQILVMLSGASLILGALSIITGFRPDIGVLLIAVFFVPVTFVMHQFWKITDPAQRGGELVNFEKNLVILGAALMFLQIAAPWPMALG